MKMDVQVAIVMGSDSDLPVMAKAADVLKEFGVDFTVHILSAHRTPAEALDFARSAREKGYKVIIAGAGMAAHLPGVLASQTILPVIGVPIGGKNLGGQDALFSIVQMPPGIPVATMAVDGAKNAGILAVEILALSDLELKEKLDRYRTAMREEVLGKNKRLQEMGYDKSLLFPR